MRVDPSRASRSPHVVWLRQPRRFCQRRDIRHPAPTIAAPMRENMPAVAGMRPDMPDVEPGMMAADPDAGRRGVQARFSGWNRTHGRPQMLIYWDRQLDDETTTRCRDHSSGTAASVAAPGIGVTSYESVREQQRVTGGTDASIGADDSDDLEMSFVSAFIDAGANLIDRSALMRKVSTRQAHEDRSDQQYMDRSRSNGASPTPFRSRHPIAAMGPATPLRSRSRIRRRPASSPSFAALRSRRPGPSISSRRAAAFRRPKRIAARRI
jgi:hypothetical protein